MRVLWTTRRSNQSILKEISPKHSLERLMLEKNLESPLDSKEIKAILKEINPFFIGLFIGRTDAEAKAPILWPPDVKCQLIRKDSDAGKD